MLGIVGAGRLDPVPAVVGRGTRGVVRNRHRRDRGRPSSNGSRTTPDSTSLRAHVAKVYRRTVAAWTMTRRAASATGLVVAMAGCTSIDPGPDFVVPNATFDPDYFYCHVEPQFLFAPAYQCGSGQPSDNGQ